MKSMEMSLKEAALWFTGMSLIIFVGLHFVTPALDGIVPLYVLYYGSMSIPLVISLILVLVFYRLELKDGLHTMSFMERFRLKKLTKKDILYSILLVLVWFITFIIINSITGNVLIRPEYLQYADDTWFNVSIKGNYLIPVWLIIFLLLNVYGEELFWRGYMLPKLENRYGDKAWMINGGFWVLFHIPVFYIMPAIAPGAIFLVYLVQKQKNTNIGIIGHLFLNGAELIPLIVLVFAA